MRGETKKVVEVLVGELRCAVPLDRALEVLPRIDVTRLPGVQLPVAGYIRHRGRVVPALDLRARLDRDPRVPPFDEHVLVVRVRRADGVEGPLALLVDRVMGVLELELEGAEPPGRDVPPVAGMLSLPDGMLLVVDPDRALSIEEDRAVRAALEEEGE